ncbi:MAG: hypothetical protein AAF288_06975 [Planctomycetota bacterium]
MTDVPKPITVALVGHCGFDSSMLQSAVRRAAETSGLAVAVSQVHDAAAIDKAPPDLLLVNRKLIGRFPKGDGPGLIERWLAGGEEGQPPRRAMLVSNLDDAQAQAEALGAEPGVGKAGLEGQAAQQRLTDALRACVASAG